MLQKLRNYVTPLVATIALAVLGATALAVSPIAERLLDDPLDSVTGSQEEQDTTDVIRDVEDFDLIVKPVEGLDEEVPTPTATPANEKPNHGHFVSCIAKAAKADSTLQGRQKGAVVSAAAKQKEAVLPKGADCSAAYNVLKAAAVGQTTDPGGEEQTSVNAKQEEKKAEKEVRKEQPQSVAKVEAPRQNPTVQGRGQGGPPAERGSQAASQNGGGRGPKK